MATEFFTHEFDLRGVKFGGGKFTPLVVTDFDPGSAEFRTQDAELSNGDGMVFGRDYLDGPTWSFEITTNPFVLDGQMALAKAEELASAWRADSVRMTPNSVTYLRYRIAGRWRRVYGRPRRFTSPRGDYFNLHGASTMMTDFKCADHLHYWDTEESISVDMVPASVGGLTAPLADPLSTIQSGGEREGQFVVQGDAPTWVLVTFHGPGTNLYARVGGFTVGLTGTLAYDQSVTIDPRPWARSAIRNDGAGVGGMLSRTTRMERMTLKPGGHEVYLGGIDATNRAKVTLRWRPASYSL